MQGTDALEGLAHHLFTHLGLLPKLVSAGNLLLPGAVHGLVLLGGGGCLGGIGLRNLGTDFRRVDNHQRVAFSDQLAFDAAELLDSARNFAGNAVLRGLCLTLDDDGLGTGNDVSDDGDDK